MKRLMLLLFVLIACAGMAAAQQIICVGCGEFTDVSCFNCHNGNSWGEQWTVNLGNGIFVGGCECDPEPPVRRKNKKLPKTPQMTENFTQQGKQFQASLMQTVAKFSMFEPPRISSKATFLSVHSFRNAKTPCGNRTINAVIASVSR